MIRLAMLLLILSGAPPGALQSASAPGAYPTADLLTSTVVPVRDRVLLAQTINGVTTIAPPPMTAPVRNVGEQRVFRAVNASDNYAFDVNATLMALGEHIALYVQDGANVEAAAIERLAEAFDARIYDQVRGLWGSEDTPGIDGDPRIYGLFTHELGAGTAAYFASDHIEPREAAPNSNEHEMFFFNLDAFGASPRELESTIAHEFQHMIRSHVQRNEDYWLNEGWSEFTQLYLYDVPVGEIVAFMNMPETQLNTWSLERRERVRHYGAALLFVTYFYDRYGLEALQAVSADDATRGLDSFDRVLRAMGEPGVDVLFADWVAANAIMNPLLADGRYGYTSIPALISALPQQTVTRYPVEVGGTVNQYSADYIALQNVRDAETLTITLEAPPDAGLIPTTATSAPSLWYSNRADVASTTLTRAFDLSGLETATLRYNIWHDFEPFWDYGYVMVSADDGASWTPLEATGMTRDDPHGLLYAVGYTGAADWHSQQIDLSAYGGREILVRFQMITDDAVTLAGMAIDDIVVPELGYVDGANNPDEWQADGWVWSDNRLPQGVWVQALVWRGLNVTVERWRGDGGGTWTLDLNEGADQVIVAVSPFAPVTTVEMAYRLRVTKTS